MPKVATSRLARSVAAGLLGLGGLVAFSQPAGAAVVHPRSCPTDKSYTINTHTPGWMATNTVSAFQSAPGIIALSRSSTATATMTVSSTTSVEVSAFVVKASEAVGVSLAGSVGRASTWTYTKNYTGSNAQRVVVSHRAYAFVFTTHADLSNCTSATYTNQKSTTPTSSSSSTQYCIHLDGYPASTWETASGGCVDQG